MGFYTPDTSFTDDFLERGRHVLAYRVSFYFSIFFGILALAFSIVDLQVSGIYFLVFFVSIINIIYLRRKRKSKPVFWFYTVVGSAALIYVINFMLYTLHYADLMWTVCLILFAFIGLSYRAALIILAIHAASFAYFITFRLNLHIADIEPLHNIALGITSFELLMTFIIFAFLIDQHVRYQSYAEKQLQEMNNALKLQNTENLTLLREIHHRVKNNLQIVVSLLRMQKEKLRSDEAKTHFRTAIDRVLTISLIHKKLYEFGELSRVDIHTYLTQLIQEISELHAGEITLNVVLKTDIDQLDAKSIVPLGLIVNELMTNSVKHAKLSASSEIFISLNKIDRNELELIYDDRGTWHTGNNPGFGSELLLLLTEQLEGELKREESRYSIRFSNPENEH